MFQNLIVLSFEELINFSPFKVKIKSVTYFEWPEKVHISFISSAFTRKISVLEAIAIVFQSFEYLMQLISLFSYN